MSESPKLSEQARVMKFYTEKKMQTEQTEKQKDEEQEQGGRTPPDPELRAIKRIREILADFPPGARGRVLSYVVDRAQEERFLSNPVGRTYTEWQQAQEMEKLSAAPLAR